MAAKAITRRRTEPANARARQLGDLPRTSSALKAPPRKSLGNSTLPYRRRVNLAHHEAFVFEQPAHLAVASFVQTDAKPGVAALGRLGLDLIEIGRARPRARRPAAAARAPPPSGEPRRRTRYSRRISLEGCMSRWASSPSLVNSSSPEVFTSSRPTTIQRPLAGGGSRSKTVGRPSGSLRVVTSPTGL